MDEPSPSAPQPDVTAELDLSALEAAEADLADVELVLACLERGAAERCAPCEQARADGTLAARPALEICSSLRAATVRSC